MDRARPDSLSTSRLIAIAASLVVGGAEEVRCRMGSCAEDFSNYVQARSEPSWVERGRLVGLIMEEQVKVIAARREAIRTVRAFTGKIRSKRA